MKRIITIFFGLIPSLLFADYEWVNPVLFAEVGGGQWGLIGTEIYFFDRLISFSFGGGYTEGFNPRANGGYARDIVLHQSMHLYLGDKNNFRVALGIQWPVPYTIGGYISESSPFGSPQIALSARFEYPIAMFVPFIDVLYFPGYGSQYYWEGMSFNQSASYGGSGYRPWGIGIGAGVKWH